MSVALPRFTGPPALRTSSVTGCAEVIPPCVRVAALSLSVFSGAASLICAAAAGGGVFTASGTARDLCGCNPG